MISEMIFWVKKTALHRRYEQRWLKLCIFEKTEERVKNAKLWGLVGFENSSCCILQILLQFESQIK